MKKLMVIFLTTAALVGGGLLFTLNSSAQAEPNVVKVNYRITCRLVEQVIPPQLPTPRVKCRSVSL